jgi:hypothetical protein
MKLQNHYTVSQHTIILSLTYHFQSIFKHIQRTIEFRLVHDAETDSTAEQRYISCY